jgi:hypothetical protein
MQSILDSLMQQVIAQGFSITLLTIAVWYFYKENEKMKKAHAEDKAQLITYLEEDRVELVSIVDKLTEVLKQNTAVLTRIEHKI